MGDQKFKCGRYKNRAFEDIAKSDPAFCKAVLKSPVCNQYYPEEFKLYLLSLKGSTPICGNNVTSFVSQWDEKIRAEFEQIIGSPDVTIREVHPKAAGYSYGNLGVFIRFFLKKCIYNVQNANAVNRNMELFASIFPFKVSKTVPAACSLPVRDLFDQEFYGAVAAFMVRHFEEKCDSTESYVDLFLRNVHHFKNTHFDEGSVRKLKTVVASLDPDKGPFGTRINDYRMTIVNEYLEKFPRLNEDGVVRYVQLRRIYNSLCAAFGLDDLGEQSAKHIRKLPEINCYELLSLLEPNFFEEQRSKYVEYFLKYFFFFVYAVESVKDHPILFIDDPLYECLKGYAEYRDSREVAENLQLSIWQVTLAYRRTQALDLCKFDWQFDVDRENLQNIRNYIESFEGIESAIVDYKLPTDLLVLGISFVIKDQVFQMYYRTVDKSTLIDFHEDIIRALMCPMDIKKAIIYNGYTGKEMSVMVPQLKTEVLEFVRRHNKYDPNGPNPEKDMFAASVEGYVTF